MRPLLGCLALLLLAVPLVSAADLTADARKALDKYYEERLKRPFIRLPDDPEPKVSPPPWEAPIKQLASEKADDRRAAVAYLRELLVLALEDETSGTAPWRNTPYWGGGADVPARDLRQLIAEALAQTKPPAEALPLLKWYLDNEPADRFLPPVVTALGKLDGADADALRAELATKPHPNAIIAADAIRQITARKQTLPADQLLALCRHHRSAIRTAARALNTQQEGRDPGAFDPAKAIRTAPVTKLMDRLLKLMPDLPGAKAEFVTVTVRYLDDKKAEREKHEDQGWLIKNEKGAVEIYTPYGRVRTFRDEQKTTIWTREESADGVNRVELAVVSNVTVAPVGTADLVAKAVAARKGGGAGNELSENGGLSGQFRGSGATLFEATLGAWLYRAGKDEDAPKVLLPALDSVYRDDHLALVVRDQLGELVGQKMLVAFVGDRDYPAALKHAKLITELYPETRFHTYAKGFIEQLPKRMDDFTKLKLPTPAEWTELKKALTREQQIDFLCDRMRLLNCFQMGQPGGYDPGETQYAEPCGLSENAAWGHGGGKTEVINPLTELTGYRGPRADGEPKQKGLDLTVKDVPRLSKYLSRDHYVLIVSFWRDFAPDRNLASTRPLFAAIINKLAYKNLCRVREWKDLSPEEIDKHIDRINRWAAANAHKTPLQLERAALDEDIAAGEGWYDVRDQVVSLLEQKQADTYDVLKRFLTHEKSTDQDRASILRLYVHYDAARAKDLAPQYLDHKHDDVRFAAALLVFKTGDRAKLRETLGNKLGRDRDESWWEDTVAALIADETPESRKQLARLFANPQLPKADRYGPRASVLAACAKAGMKEPYTFYATVLGAADDPSDAEQWAREIVGRFAPEDAAVKDIVKKFPEPKDQIPPLKTWLESKRDKKD